MDVKAVSDDLIGERDGEGDEEAKDLGTLAGQVGLEVVGRVLKVLLYLLSL